MLKRIQTWMTRVRELHDDIIAHMPTQYRSPNLDEEDVLTANPTPDERDPVACQWTACDQAGLDLFAELLFLASAIAERTGVCVPFDRTVFGGDDPDEPEPLPDAGESAGS